MRQVSLRALRAHWPSATGVFLTMLLASALVSASGTLLESGLRADDPFSPTATLLPAVMGSFGGVAVMIAVFVVSSAFAAALRDRRREFALLRAVGATSRQVRALVSTEVMMISLPSIALGGVAGLAGARALVPLLRSSGIVDEGFAPVLSPWPLLGAATLLLPAAWIAGRLAAREMAQLSPTTAVNTSTVEMLPIGRGRIITAWVLAGSGVATTATPIFVPGTLGGATGAASALLFITAVALAGPALVLRGATWLANRKVMGSRAASVLATSNARGYSRRLTAAVVPLALLVSLGSIQTGTHRIVSLAGAQQLGDAVHGDFVWQGSSKEWEAAQGALAELPGVTATASTNVGVVQAKVEATDEDAPFLEGLSWETMSVRLVDADAALIDPGVSEGDLRALGGSGTIAVSSDALIMTGKGVGDQIELRYADGSETSPTIVAVYERGLGLGGLIVGPEGFAAATGTAGSATVIVQTETGTQADVQQSAREAGLSLVPTHEYVQGAIGAGAGEDRLSNTLLIVLLAFIGIAAGNALLLATRSRAGEFALLGRLGATRRQLRTMLALEATFVAVGAVAVGTATALPGLAAASLSLIRGFSLGVDLTMYVGLSTAATAIAFLGVAGARLRVPV
jgi:putative ABC transport system permease protein